MEIIIQNELGLVLSMLFLAALLFCAVEYSHVKALRQEREIADAKQRLEDGLAFEQATRQDDWCQYLKLHTDLYEVSYEEQKSAYKKFVDYRKSLIYGNSGRCW
ncbi:MAG: hypothetical protein J5934_07765 [Succinivibrio sp.]|nr:hypothetical protein [Succinivibrio sp.]